MENLEKIGNLDLKVPDTDEVLNDKTSYWNAKTMRVEKYPLHDRYITSNITEEEWSLHKKEHQEKNCYFCTSTKNGTEDGTLDCTNTSAPHFGKRVTNLTICEDYKKISEILNDDQE